MLKSIGNVVSPDEFIEKYGSDTFRMYMMFMGSYNDGGDWSDEGITGIFRFLNRVWRLVESLAENPPSGNEDKQSKEIERIRHYTIKMVTQDLERFHFNTAISRLMELVNAMFLYVQDFTPGQQNKRIIEQAQETVILLLAPFAPHFAEELWERIGRPYSIFNQDWPSFDEAKTQKKLIPIVVPVNGKVRTAIECELDSPDDQVLEKVLSDEKVMKHIEGKSVVKKIVIKNRLVNLVVK